MACEYVPIYNVALNDFIGSDQLTVQDVLADRITVGTYDDTRNIDASLLFKSPNIIPENIDSDWCAGDTPEERFVELSTDEPISCYDYIEYGGCQTDIPEIYFSNLKAWNVGATEIIEGTNDRYIGTFINVPLYTEPSILSSYYNDKLAAYPGDPSAGFAPAFYRDDPNEFLQKYGISARVGCDYGIIVPSNVKFKLKITIILGDDYLTEVKKYYDANRLFLTPTPVGGSIVPGGVAGAGIAYYFDGFTGPLTPLIGAGIWGGLVYLVIGYVVLNIVMMALQTYIYFISTINNTVLTNIRDAKDGWQIWKLITGGVYNNFDIRESEIEFSNGSFKEGKENKVNILGKNYEYLSELYDIKNPLDFESTYVNRINNSQFINNTNWIVIGNWNFTDNKANKSGNNIGTLTQAIQLDDKQYYELKYSKFNNGNSGDITVDLSNLLSNIEIIQNTGNVVIRGYAIYTVGAIIFTASADFEGYIYNPTLIILPNRFPADNLDNRLYKSHNWFNFESKPRGLCYNKMTPPPITMCIVELIPVSNCVVSTDPTKPHIFSFISVPDKAVAPNFDVIPKLTIHASTLVKLQDAIYSDFIYLRDLETRDTFDSLKNRYINTACYRNNEVSIWRPYSGEDILIFGSSIAAGQTGMYHLNFMKEIGDRYQQLVFDSYFVDRGYGLDKYNFIKKYWEVNNADWIIRGGAIYKISNTDSYFTQNLPNMSGKENWNTLYKFEIEIVNSSSGSAYIDLTDNFESRLCAAKYNNTWTIGGAPATVHTTTLNSTDYSEGVLLIDNKVYFSLNKKYVIILPVLSDNDITKILKIGGTASFDGGITNVKLQRMSPRHPNDPNRSAVMADFVIRIIGTNEPSKVFLLFKGTLGEFQTISIDLGRFMEVTEVTIDWGDATNNVYSVGSINTFTHEYLPSAIVYRLITINIAFTPEPFTPIFGDYTYTYTHGAILPYLKVNNINIVDFADYYGVLLGAEVDFSNCNLNSKSVIDAFTGIFTMSLIVNDRSVSSFSYTPILSRFIGIRKLLLNNNPIADNLFYLNSVSEYLDITNTDIYGDLAEISLITDTIKLEGSNVSYYSTTPKMNCRNIWWQNLQTPMDVIALNYLVRDLYQSNITGGKLYIAGTNPEITEEEILWYIFKLVHERDWVIQYNGYYITTANEENYIATAEDDYVYVND